MQERFGIDRRAVVGIAAAAVALLVMVGCSSTTAVDSTVRGTATYRERMALPPGAVLEVTLQDVSLADAPARVLGTARTENPGNPPFSFEISYDPGQIDDRHTYAVRATIRVDDTLMFTTDTTYPVLTRGAGNEVEVVMIRAPRSTQTAAPRVDGTYWKLAQIGRDRAPDLGGAREPHIVLNPADGSVAGTGGCNRIAGTYKVDGEWVGFGKLSMTRKACVDDADVDAELVAVLENAVGYRLEAGQLELLDADGYTLARFTEGKAD